MASLYSDMRPNLRVVSPAAVVVNKRGVTIEMSVLAASRLAESWVNGGAWIKPAIIRGTFIRREGEPLTDWERDSERSESGV